MTTVYSQNADGQERYDTIRPEMVGKVITQLRTKGALNIHVI